MAGSMVDAPPAKPKTRLGEARDLLAVAAVYFIAGKAGLTLAFVNSSVTAVWPPTGIALASLLVLGMRCWPAILAGAFLVNFSTTATVSTSIGIALGNTAEGLAGAWLVRRFAGGSRCFERPRDVFRFALLAGVLATALGATAGATTLSLAGLARWTDYGAIWLTWWLGDAGGALIVAPLLLLWAVDRSPRLDESRYAEALLLGLAALLAGGLVFRGWFVAGLERQPIEFVCLPILVWGAFRFSPRVAALVVFVLSALAVWGTIDGYGPFAGPSVNRSLILLAVFLAVLSVTTLGLSAVIGTRRAAEAPKERLAALVADSGDAIIGKGLDGTILSWNRGAERIYGFTAAEAVGRSLAELTVPPERRDEFAEILARIARGERIKTHETVRRTKSGGLLDVSLTVSPVRDDQGRIVGGSAIARDITARKRAEEEILHQAFHDPLTGLPNRRLFRDRLDQALARARREGLLLAVGFLDLDGFKAVNDTLGHAGGDLLLRQVAQRLQRCLREDDTVARVGGDEFTILLSTLRQREDAGLVAEKILGTVARPFRLERHEVPVSASLGLAVFPRHGGEAETLLRNADRALYRAKAAGKATFRVAEAASDARAEERLLHESGR
jgi:diguanylate cyclase (GGDEF)-like protein/PAS domain S-box-containing protein